MAMRRTRIWRLLARPISGRSGSAGVQGRGEAADTAGAVPIGRNNGVGHPAAQHRASSTLLPSRNSSCRPGTEWALSGNLSPSWQTDFSSVPRALIASGLPIVMGRYPDTSVPLPSSQNDFRNAP